MGNQVRIIFVISGIFLFSSQNVFTQTSKFSPGKNIIIESRFQSGYTLPLYDAIAYLTEKNIHAFEINVSFPTYGEDYWERLYRYPRTGAGYSYSTLGNNNVFGKAHALYGFMNIPVYRRKNIFSLNYQITFGLAYITKHFDPVNDHLNRAISSHGNVYIRFGLDTRLRINKRCEVLLEAGGTHYSNGKFRSPNYGINTATLSFGANYLIGNTAKTYETPDIPAITKKNHQSLILSAGKKVFDNLLGNNYFVSSVSYNFDHKVSHKRRLGLGADLFYDKSISEALANDEGVPDNNFSDMLRFGLHAAHTVQYKDLLLSLQMGYYLYSKYTDLSRVYSRVALQYLLTDHIMLNVSVKSHFAKADFVEWGIGYHW